jgi:hypothetical protein
MELSPNDKLGVMLLWIGEDGLKGEAGWKFLGDVTRSVSLGELLVVMIVMIVVTPFFSTKAMVVLVITTTRPWPTVLPLVPCGSSACTSE